MRKREGFVWEDPRFSKKQPKKMKMGNLGEMPPPMLKSSKQAMAQVCPPARRRAPPARPTTASRPSTARSTGGPCPSAGPPRPAAARAPAGLARSQAAAAPASASPMARPKYRAGGMVQKPAPVVVVAPPSGPSSSQQAYRSSQQPCPPEQRATYRVQPPCPPDPCPPAEPPVTPVRTGLRPPGFGLRPPSGMRAPSGLRPPSSGLRPPSAGLRAPSGLRPPVAKSTARTVVARRSPPPAPCPEPCPPEPCAPEPPCPPEPCPRDPCDPCLDVTTAGGTSFSIASSTPLQRSGLRKPSRFGSSSIARPKPQKIVLLPGDINPNETTVIEVEPPQAQESSLRGTWSPFTSEAEVGMAEMEACLEEEEETPPRPVGPYKRILRRSEKSYYRPRFLEPMEPIEEEFPIEEECPIEERMEFAEPSTGLLIDLGPPDPCTGQQQFFFEPVDLIQWSPPPDPFSPDRLRPPSPSVSPPPLFSPPSMPYPRYAPPSYIEKYTRNLPVVTDHPILDYARMPKKAAPELPSPPKLPWNVPSSSRTPQLVDREVVARSVPFHTNISTICRDDEEDEDLGLLPECIGGEFETPLDYQAVLQQDRILRAERRKQQRGPTIAETRELCARIRDREQQRREQLESERLEKFFAGSEPPQADTMEECRARYRRVMERAGHWEQLWAVEEPGQRREFELPVLECAEGLDDIDLDAIDLMELGDEGPC